jgi:hypothetical protein
MIRVTVVLFFGSMLPLASQTPEQTRDQTPDQIMTGLASQLTARISSLLPRRTTVSFEIQDLTPLPASEWSSFRSRLQDELHKTGLQTAGVETTTTQPESRVRVTLTEDARGWLLVAEVFTEGGRQIAMLPWTLPSLAQAKPRVTIARQELWTQAEPILDVLLIDSDSEMLVLSANAVSGYRWTQGKWTPTATASLVLSRPMPRDQRGRLETTAGGFQAFLPVATCAGAWDPELKLTCAGGTASWPGTSGTHWVADRNLLEGDAPAPSFEGWGSDWASIADPCGAGTVVIASSANNEHDSVRAYLVRDGRADPVSDPLPLSGAVTALWPAGSGAESGKAATLVVHNLQTGEYDASRLGLVCSQ